MSSFLDLAEVIKGKIPHFALAVFKAFKNFCKHDQLFEIALRSRTVAPMSCVLNSVLIHDTIIYNN